MLKYVYSYSDLCLSNIGFTRVDNVTLDFKRVIETRILSIILSICKPAIISLKDNKGPVNPLSLSLFDLDC